MDPLTQLVSDTLSKAPDWLRHDLLSRDRSLRERAEETLSAMIAAALRQADKDACLGYPTD